MKRIPGWRTIARAMVATIEITLLLIPAPKRKIKCGGEENSIKD